MPKKEKVKPTLIWKTAKDFAEEQLNRLKISTGTPIDELLRSSIDEKGGIYEHELVEIAGEYGSGKTQFCYSILCNMQKQFQDVGPLKVMWIDTENTFSTTRLIQIAKNKDLNIDQVLSNVHLLQPSKSEEQMEAVNQISKFEPSLIIIDSLITLFRNEYQGREKLPPRQGQLLTFLSILKKYLREHRAIAVSTNHVMANPDQLPYMTYEQKVLVLGGHAVYHAINNRILIRKPSGNKRIARLIDSAEYPPSEVIFYITEKGIEPVEMEAKKHE